MKKLLLKNMKWIDETLKDIEIQQRMVTRIADSIEIDQHEVIDGNGEIYVSRGFIDLHTHCFNKFQLYGDEMDKVGYQQGVTTIVDAGTSGADTIHELYQQSQQSKTNVLAFINIAKQGIATQDELSNLENLDERKLCEACEKYQDFIVGLKVRMSQSVLKDTGNEPLQFAQRMKKKLHLPIMVHIGSAPAQLSDVMSLVSKGDIVTHIFNPKANGILDGDGKVKPYVLEAHHQGVYFDLGHGSESFSFEVCQQAKNNGVMLDSISSDIYRKNRINGPVYSLITTMNKMLACGYTLQQVIDAVTITPAKMLQRSELGELKVGCDADLTLFQLSNQPLELVDSKGDVWINERNIEPVAVVLKGEYIKIGGMYGNSL